MRDVVGRLYRTRLVLSCFILVGTGIALLTVENLLADSSSWAWLTSLPLHELGATLIGGGIFGVWLDYFMRLEQEAVDERRLRSLLHEQAPAMRDAVLEAFAANHEDLKRVATPEMLDQVITNSLALRLDDQQFASEVYADIREQAIGAQERWYDANLSIDVSPAENQHHFIVTVRWEYTTILAHAQRRFVCLSDRDEYAELATERGATSAWYCKPSTGLDASAAATFELLRFAVAGEERPIRRGARKNGQTYTVSMTAEQLATRKPATVAYTYRLVMARTGHLLFFDIEQPTRDLQVDFDYTGCGIASVSTLDLVPSVRATRIESSPAGAPAESVRLDLDGWIFPRSGVAFVWTLDRESHPSKRNSSQIARTEPNVT